MIEFYVKYLFMLICSFYCFTKLLNLSFAKKNYIISLGVFLVYDILICLAKLYVPHMMILVFIATIFVHSSIAHKTTFKITFMVTLISVGLNYFLFITSMLIISPLLLFIVSSTRDFEPFYFYLFSFIGFIQLILSIILFRFKRLKRGMPFLLKKIPNSLGVFICCFIIFLSTLFTMLESKNYFNEAILLICIILGVLLFIWWRRQLTISYLNRAHKNELMQLEVELEKLKKDNDNMSALIHKDNKLIPAMEMAVNNLLTEYSSSSDEHLNKRACELLSDLNRLTNERRGILDNQISQRNNLPTAGIIRFDSIISYMYEKARSMNINFDVRIDTDISQMIDTTVDLDTLVTLVADMTENAIIATNYSDNKNILLSFQNKNGVFSINVYDSGIHFEPYTIVNAGLKKASTHLDTGGSGIGLMTIFRLLVRSLSSFVIDETIEDTRYTKMVSVQFDSMNQFRIKSNRKEVLDLRKRNPRLIIET